MSTSKEETTKPPRRMSGVNSQSVRPLETAVIYKTVRCPNPDCKGTRVPVQRTGPSPPDHIIRHHKCEDCGRKFKSVEVIYQGENKHLNSVEEKDKIE